MTTSISIETVRNIKKNHGKQKAKKYGVKRGNKNHRWKDGKRIK